LTPGGHTIVLYLEAYRTVRHNFYLSLGSGSHGGRKDRMFYRPRLDDEAGERERTARGRQVMQGASPTGHKALNQPCRDISADRDVFL
jgi:hypothetical protein